MFTFHAVKLAEKERTNHGWRESA